MRTCSSDQIPEVISVEMKEMTDTFLGSDDLQSALGNLGMEQVIEWLQWVNGLLSASNPFPIIEISPRGGGPDLVFFFGDIHGDLITLDLIVKEFREMVDYIKEQTETGSIRLVFLGDYIDRAPKDVENGGMLTIIRVLALKAKYPENVFLLRGNHEAFELLPFSPYELPTEIMDIFPDGGSERVHSHLTQIFSDLPLFVRTANGIIALHGGFPKGGDRELSSISKRDRGAILDTLWGDPVESSSYRGEVSRKANFTRKELEEFLTFVNCKVLLRGHDYNTKGYSLYDRKVLTLFTSRRYLDKGAKGIFSVHTILQEKVNDTSDLGIRNVQEGDWPEAAAPDWIPGSPLKKGRD
ncbi:MAG: metallophosphoesterase family protein [Thermoplasmatota archaeon]